MEKIRWTTSSLLHLTAGCSVPLATWVMLGRPVDPMTIIAAGCFFFGPALYGTSTPTPRTWRETESDLTEQQPLLMGMGILAITLGAFLTLILYARATVVAPSGYPWWLVLAGLASSAVALGLAGAALARVQSFHLKRQLKSRIPDD